MKSAASFNVSLLRQRAHEIRKALAVIAGFGELTLEEFLGDVTIVSAVKYQLIVAIEAAISICNHLASRLAQRIPSSYTDCFLSLKEQGMVTPELSERLGKMARFRNLLIHLYWEVDDALVFRIMREDLKDLEAYLLEIQNWVGENV